MKRDEHGIALVITLFLMATLSALAVSLTFLSQTETASSRNYRTMSQARYGGEAGVHKTINYLLNSYVAPSAFSSYDLTASPVTCVSGCSVTKPAGTGCSYTVSTSVATAVANGCIVLSGMSGVSSNYPDSTIASAFNSAVQGTLAVNSSGSTTNSAAGVVKYGAAAILMSMQEITNYGGGTAVIQTWKIVSDGTVPGAVPATVEVTSTLQQDIADADTFAAFATGTGCGAINLGGTVDTQSYDSSIGTTTANSGGNIGTNGNLTIGGHVDVHGSLSSPRTGVGSCTSGSVTALTESGAATVDNNAVVQLPQTINFPTPVIPPSGYGFPSTASQSTCAQFAVSFPATCTTVTIGSNTTITIDPMGTTVSLGNISTASKTTLVLDGGTYIVNSVGAGSNTNLSVGTSMLGTQDVVLDLVGRTSTGSQMSDPFDTNGQAVVNSSMNAAALQVVYAGTGTINMTGGSNAAMVLYAPNAAVVTHGNGNIWGSVLSASITSSGTPAFIYDRHLQSTMHVAGNYLMTSFNWKKY